jgi:hypothetical protein
MMIMMMMLLLMMMISIVVILYYCAIGLYTWIVITINLPSTFSLSYSG